MSAPRHYTPQLHDVGHGLQEDVRTVFLLGFPSDVKDRELHNLMRWCPGFEASQMNFKGDQPMGFALFSTKEMAMAARDAFQNYLFDFETNSVLRTEMARKNLYVKRGEATSRDPIMIVNRHQEALNFPAPDNYMADDISHLQSLPMKYDVASGSQHQSYMGYEHPTTNTTHQKRGVTLTSSDRGGIRIQFSKNPFGQKSCLVGGLQTNGKAETSSSLATSRSKLVAENLGASEPS